MPRTGPSDSVATGLTWHLHRLRRMSPAEVRWRLEDRARQALWSRRQFPAPDDLRPNGTPEVRQPPAFPSNADLVTVGEGARRALLAAADELLAGRADILGAVRADMDEPDWSLDPTSGTRFPEDRSAFRIDYRSTEGRNVKHVWELSRHHHLTVLACAWRFTRDERYASMIDAHLRSWWSHNPVLTGVNWSTGIELGIRLISWVWTRRLLDGWDGAPPLFEENGEALRHIYWHQRSLATFQSRGSSANNHVIAEAAGQLVASCAFPWFQQSGRWRIDAARLLEAALSRNTFVDGVNREQAFEYHALVAELGLVAAVEAEAADAPLSRTTWDLLARMLDAAAAVLDQSGRAPRHGDADDGRALVLAAPEVDRWRSLLATGEALLGRASWWPPTDPDVQSVTFAAMVGRQVDIGPRPLERPSHFPEAGLTVLRSARGEDGEIWCRCDGGPHGHLSIAAHAHADALSVEVRHGGTDIFADPGTYCYFGSRRSREYFRSTLAHNTIELDGQSQSVAGGPFLWSCQAHTMLREVDAGEGRLQRWSAQHDGYRRLAFPALHRRTVTLDTTGRTLGILDELVSDGDHRVRLAFHLGPSVEVHLMENQALLRWADGGGRPRSATLTLSAVLQWTSHRGSRDPFLGWYSPRLGQCIPTTTLIGSGTIASGVLRTRLAFLPCAAGADSSLAS